VLEISSEWLSEKFPELELIADYNDPSSASLDFFLAQQADARIGFLPVRSATGHFDRDAAKHFWPALKAEFREFVCTDSAKYSKSRKQLQARGGKSEAIMLSTITAAVAQVLGAAIATLVPLMALCLYAVARLGVSAYCRLNDKNSP
jgi:hypothetical protein